MIEDVRETSAALKAVIKEMEKIERLGDVGKEFKKVFPHYPIF